MDWPLARIVDVIPGRDGKSRVFLLKTKNGVLKRPIQRIYPLEICQKDVELKENYREKLKENIAEKKVKPKTRKHNDEINLEPAIMQSKIVTTRSGRRSKAPEYFQC